MNIVAKNTTIGGKLASWFSPKPKTTPEPPKTETFTYDLRDGELFSKAQSLGEAFGANHGHSKAESLLDQIRETQKISQQDGSASDFDHRPGHVVLPERTYHIAEQTRQLAGPVPASYVASGGPPVDNPGFG